jgi:hypothetical protein
MPVITEHCMVIFIIITMFQLLKRLPANETGVNNVKGKITNKPGTENIVARFRTQNEMSEFS